MKVLIALLLCGLVASATAFYGIPFSTITVQKHIYPAFGGFYSPFGLNYGFGKLGLYGGSPFFGKYLG
ncbi:hypothetical protein BaRGS_00004163 [Batillaria attramentaria]|uniref:Uncharacterized protein n=1 Tax=Batillaria attramentaria TaxID=370345 RepID=A0ABD0LYU0_9CAEN